MADMRANNSYGILYHLVIVTGNGATQNLMGMNHPE